jgi:hypothetical protein
VDDVELLVGIRNESVAYKVALGDFAWGKGGWTEVVARQRIEFNDWYLIELDETPVGMLSMSWEDQKYWGPQDPDAGYAHGCVIRGSWTRVSREGGQRFRAKLDVRSAATRGFRYLL